MLHDAFLDLLSEPETELENLTITGLVLSKCFNIVVKYDSYMLFRHLSFEERVLDGGCISSLLYDMW
jgi:hypothetical protein